MGARERLPVNNELDILIKFIRITDTMSALVSFFHKKNVNIQALIILTYHVQKSWKSLTQTV